MFPTDPIRRYVNLSFAKKSDELAKVYAAEVANLNKTSSPNSGMYFNALMPASVRNAKSRIEAWVEIVKAGCREANRPVDNEVRNYMLSEIHVMCEAAKGHVAHALRLRLTQSGMAAPGLEQSLVTTAEHQILAIESEIGREFKIEELRESVRKEADSVVSPNVRAPAQMPTDSHTGGDDLAFARRVPKALTYYWEFLKRFGEESYRSGRKLELLAVLAVTLISYCLSLQDKNAWESAKVALEANLILFFIFVVFHLFHTPYLLHREHLRLGSREIRIIHAKFGFFGCFLLLAIITAFSYRIVKPWVFQTLNVIVNAPPPPTITQEQRRPATEISPPKGSAKAPPLVGPSQPTMPNVGNRPPTQTPVQPNPQVAQGAVPQTQLERLIQTDRNLTTGDRERLSNALYEYAQFLDQGMALGSRASMELAKISQDRSNGSLPKNVDGHTKLLNDIGASGWAYSKSFGQIRGKWKYYPEQTEYIFGDNPDNLGPNALINTAVGFANYLAFWSKIVNKDQREILNLEALQQNDYTQSLNGFFHWVQGCQQRLNQVKQSIDPNGIVQPIPSSRPAPAPGFFMMMN